MPGNIAVTGATGHLGGLVVRHLLDTVPADAVVAVVRDPARAQDLATAGVVVRIATYDDPEALQNALADVDRLVFVSGSEIGRRAEQHRNVVDAAVRSGVGRVLYTSAPHADTSALAVNPDHRATEAYLAASGLAWTVTRNNWYTENYLGELEAARASGEVVAAVGDGRIASALRTEYAEGIARVIAGEAQAGRIYEFAGDHAWDYPELAAAFAEVLGHEVVYRQVGAEEQRERLRGFGLDEGVVQFATQLELDAAAGLLADAPGDLSRILGRPTLPLVDALRTLVSDDGGQG